jgi:hypothetical protein
MTTVALTRRPAAVWAACVALVALSLAAELARPVTADMGFFLYAADRVLHGARLYRDFVDMNPPPIFAFNVPIVLLARATHVPEFLLYRIASAVVIGALLVYQGRIVHRYLFPDEPGRARYLILLLCFALFAMARIDFGQREHFVLALLLPYLLLVGAELRGRRPRSLEAGAIGILAAIAVAFKPYFGLVWLAAEGLRRVRASPVERWRITPDMAGMLGFLAAYVLAILWLTPDYLGLSALMGSIYQSYMREPFANLLVLGPGAPLVWFALLAFLVLRRQSNRPELCALLAWAVVSCFIAGAAQQKEFRYHFYPALALAFVLLGLLAADLTETARHKSERIYGRVTRALLVAIVVVIVGSTAFEAITGGSARNRQQRAELLELVAAVRARAGGRPVGVLSYTIESAFPLVNYADVPLAIRFPCLWPFAASYWDSLASGGALRYHTVAAMPPAERYFFGAVREDLLATRPNLLLMLRPARDAAANGLRRLHYMQYFGRDPELAVFFSRYELVGQKGEYLLYQPRQSAAGPVGPAPSAAPATLDARPAPHLREIGIGRLDPESLLGLGIFVIAWVLAGTVRRRRLGDSDRVSG